MIAQLLIQIDVGFSTQVALLWLWKLVVKEALHNQGTLYISHIAYIHLSHCGASFQKFGHIGTR